MFANFIKFVIISNTKRAERAEKIAILLAYKIDRKDVLRYSVMEHARMADRF